jgi:hypothetical protein
MWSVLIVTKSGAVQSELTTDDQLTGAVSFAAGWNARGSVVSDLVAVVVDSEHAKQLLADPNGN